MTECTNHRPWDTETLSVTKFHTMNIMRSGTRLIKHSISRAWRNHAFGIHESRHNNGDYKFCTLKINGNIVLP